MKKEESLLLFPAYNEILFSMDYKRNDKIMNADSGAEGQVNLIIFMLSLLEMQYN